MSRIADDARGRFRPDEPRSTEPAWEVFRERKDRTDHCRRMFVAKFNAAYWGEPWDDPDLWHPTQPASWVGNEPGGALSCPDLKSAMVGDLIVVMRTEYRDEATGLKPADDLFSPFAGRPKLLGVLHVVQVQTQRFPHGPDRPSTKLWHLPLVRFDDGNAVDVVSLRSMDPAGVGSIAPFTIANWTLVGCRTGTEAALLASACSLPSEVFTAKDLIKLASRLSARRCGMRDDQRRYWADLRYRHQVIELIAETAVRIAAGKLADAGWIVDDSTQRVPLWGGDLDCARLDPVSGSLQQLCVEVKGTRYARWRGRVHLQKSQRQRARRASAGAPLPTEVGYGWELHVQPGVPTDHHPARDRSLLPMEVFSAAWVEQHWKDTWIA